MMMLVILALLPSMGACAVLLATGASDVIGTRIVMKLKGNVTSFGDPSASTKSTTYFGTVTLGSPAQALQVLVDTGSELLWVPGDKCTQAPCLNHRQYRKALSRTYQRNPSDEAERISTSFGTGKLTGQPAVDMACFGDSTTEKQFCTRTRFFVADHETTYPFVDLPFDGILGLAFPSGARDRDTAGMCAEFEKAGFSIFSIRLNNPLAEDAGEVVFGTHQSPPPSKAPVAWAPLAQEAGEKGYWLVSLLSIHIGDHLILLCDEDAGPTEDGCQAALDTGSSWMMGPDQQIMALLEALGWDRTCSNLSRLPSINIAVVGFGGPVVLTLEATDFIEDSDGHCDAAFASMPPGAPALWVFGQPLLRRYATFHDLHARRAGFEIMDQSRNRDAIRISGGSVVGASQAAGDVQYDEGPIFRRPHDGLLDVAKEISEARIQGTGYSLATEHNSILHRFNRESFALA